MFYFIHLFFLELQTMFMFIFEFILLFDGSKKYFRLKKENNLTPKNK